MAGSGPQVFISYQRSDGEFARQVREHLVANRVQTWMNQYDIPVSAHWPAEIDKGLAASDIVVGIRDYVWMSAHTIDNASWKRED